MAKSLEQIQAQIAKLRSQAAALEDKAKEGVIARIKDAIAHYGLSAVDLGLESRRGPKPGAKRAGRPATKAAGKRTKGVIKYADDAGHTWTGKGTRPNWFKAAIAAGKTAEDLLVKKPT